MAAAPRRPLTPLSPNARSVEVSKNRSRIASSVDRSRLPSFGFCFSGSWVLQSPFVEGGMSGGAGLDNFWLNYFGAMGSQAWSLDDWIEDVMSDDRATTLNEDTLFAGMEDYSADEAYGVTYQELYDMLRGRTVTTLMFLKAEGLLMRLLLTVDNHPTREIVFKAWVVLVGRFVGGGVLGGIAKALETLKNVPSTFAGCNVSDGFVGQFQAHAAAMIRKQSLWLYIARSVEDVRDRHWGPWGYEEVMCCVHFRDCVGAMRVAPLGWEETRENTPLHEEATDEYDREHLAAQRFHGGNWPYPGFTDEED